MMSNIKNIISPSGKGNTLTVNSQSEPWKSMKLRHSFDLTGKPEGVRSVNVSSDNRYLIITNEGKAGKIRLVDLERLEYLFPEYSGHTASVRLTSISRDNSVFFTGSWDGSARQFEIDTGKCTQILSGFGRSPSVFLDPEQKYLFTCSYDSDVDLEAGNIGRCWDLASGKTINYYRHSNDRKDIECMDIAYEQGFVYSGSDDGCAFRWPLKGEVPLLKYFECEGSVRKVAISTKYFAAACTDGAVRVFKKSSGNFYRIFPHAEPDVRDVRISKDETRLFSGAADGSVSCFNLVSGESIYHIKIHKHWIWSICLMHDDRVLVSGSRDGTVAFLSADTGKILAQLHNLSNKDDFLITCPPEEKHGFPSGLFYTTNNDLVQVLSWDKEKRMYEKLKGNDSIRRAYINKLNLRNLIITKLKNNGQFNSLTDRFIRDRKLLTQLNKPELPQMLKAYKSGEHS